MRYSLTIGEKTLELIEGDITEQNVDAIVNAANSGLRSGGGVDGAIHRAGGPTIMKECREIGGCQPGEAVITTAGNLNAKHVIHTVGPVWRDGKSGEPETLRNAYLNSLKLAEEHDLATVAFPSISTGVYGYPVDKASFIALKSVIEYLKRSASIKTVRFVLFDAHSVNAYSHALKDLKGEKPA